MEVAASGHSEATLAGAGEGKSSTRSRRRTSSNDPNMFRPLMPEPNARAPSPATKSTPISWWVGDDGLKIGAGGDWGVSRLTRGAMTATR